MQVLNGVVEAVSKKEMVGQHGPYTKTGIKIGNDWFGTFEDNNLAKGNQVELVWDASPCGKYKNVIKGGLKVIGNAEQNFTEQVQGAPLPQVPVGASGTTSGTTYAPPAAPATVTATLTPNDLGIKAGHAINNAVALLGPVGGNVTQQQLVDLAILVASATDAVKERLKGS